MAEEDFIILRPKKSVTKWSDFKAKIVAIRCLLITKNFLFMQKLLKELARPDFL